MPLFSDGELPALYSFVFLLFVFTGPGALSLDGRRKPIMLPWSSMASQSS